MKSKILKNVSLVRLAIKQGVTEYYLPQNVDWAGKHIDDMIIVMPQLPCVDPMDGVTPVLSVSAATDIYITLYDKDNRELMHNVSYENLVHVNNNILGVDAVLNLSLCKLSLMTAPEDDYTLLIYVTYGSREEDITDVPRRSVTAEFGLAANEEISLRQVIHDYVHALPTTIKGIICWNAPQNPAWITLRDKELTYQMSNILTELCRPQSNQSRAAYDTQAALFLTDSLDVDFDNSYIREAAGQQSTQQITFLY